MNWSNESPGSMRKAIKAAIKRIRRATYRTQQLISYSELRPQYHHVKKAR
jgi:hypothetical protein